MQAEASVEKTSHTRQASTMVSLQRLLWGQQCQTEKQSLNVMTGEAIHAGA